MSSPSAAECTTPRLRSFDTPREDLHTADAIRAYGRMAGTGSEVPILDPLKAGEITRGAAKVFAVAQKGALALDILERTRTATCPNIA